MALVIGAILASACTSKHPISVPLAMLAAHQESYEGKEVETRGVVRRFTDPSGPYFLIEDAQRDRVEILPAVKAAGYVGQLVTVRGRFAFDQRIGRFIQVAEVAAASAQPSR